MSSQILVTGAAGFVGSNLALTLESMEHRVLGADNFLTGNPDNLKALRGDFVECDVTKGVEALETKARYEVVFYQGDITDPRWGNDDEILRRNVGGFRNVLGLCERHGARLVYASTAGLYGHGPVPMREDQEKDLLTAYGKSKLQMDELAAEWTKRTGLAAVGLRYFNVYGPREHYKGRAASMVYHLSRQVAQGGRPRLFKWGEQKRDFIYVKDVVAANLCAMTAPSGVYNVGTGIASTFNDVANAIKRASGRNVETEYFDMPYDAKTYQGNTQADTRLAREKLGFEAKWDLERGVDDYWAWMRENL